MMFNKDIDLIIGDALFNKIVTVLLIRELYI